MIDPNTPSQFGQVLASRQLPDGRWLSLHPMLLGNTRLCVTYPDDLHGVGDFYCYHNTEAGMRAVAEWDGETDPEGWVRHFGTARRREYAADGTYREWVNP